MIPFTQALEWSGPRAAVIRLLGGFRSMTGYTVHTGSSLKFSGGWDRIFQGKKASDQSSDAKPAKAQGVKAAKKKSSVKAAPTKSAKTKKKKAAAKSVKKGKSA